MITFDSSNLLLYWQDLAAAAPVKAGHLQAAAAAAPAAAAVHLCYSNASHSTHSALRRDEELPAERVEPLCHLPNKTAPHRKWDLVQNS